MAFALLGVSVGWVVGFAVWSASAQRRMWVLAGLGGWLVATIVIGASEVLAVFDSTPPRPVIFLAAITAGVILLARGRAGRLWARLPIAVLIVFQAFRIPVELMIWSLADRGLMNEVMTFHGRNFDIATGIAAVLLGLIGMRRELPRALAWVFNLLGIGLLIHVVAVAVLTLPTPFRVFTDGPANEVVMGAPYIWLPSVLVAAAAFGHVALTRRLLGRQTGSSTLSGSSRPAPRC